MARCKSSVYVRYGGKLTWQVWPTSACAAIVASAESLSITYPKPVDFANSPSSNVIRLHIGALPFLQLDGKSFESDRESLPGLEIQFTGNVVERGRRTLKFGSNTKTHDAYHYVLEYSWEGDIGIPELVIEFKKTAPPQYLLEF